MGEVGGESGNGHAGVPPQFIGRDQPIAVFVGGGQLVEEGEAGDRLEFGIAHPLEQGIGHQPVGCRRDFAGGFTTSGREQLGGFGAMCGGVDQFLNHADSRVVPDGLGLAGINHHDALQGPEA